VAVVAVETAGADSLAQSVAAGQRIELPAITSIATSLGAKMVCRRAFELTRSHDVHCAVVSDQQALAACARFLDDHRVLVEPACGAALAVAYDEPARLGERTLIIVCGGATVRAGPACATPDQQRERIGR
jgi:L-serine/L-threonine ammonia-lyase